MQQHTSEEVKHFVPMEPTNPLFNHLLRKQQDI